MLQVRSFLKYIFFSLVPHICACVSRDLTHIATARTTPGKMYFYLTLEFLIFWNYPVCLSVLKLAPAEYATNAFSSKWKCEKLAVVVHALQTWHWSFHVVILQRTAKKCTKIQNARAQLFFCSSNLLFGDVLVGVAVVFCVRYRIQDAV